MGIKEELEKIYDEEKKLKGDAPEEIPQDDEDEGGEGGAPAEDDNSPAPEEPEPEGDEDKTPKEPEKKEEKPDNAAFARMRMEIAESKKREDALLKELEALKAQKAQPEQPQQTETQQNPAIDEVRQEYDFQRAAEEFQFIEQQVKANIPDYDAVAQQYFTALAQSLKERNPNLPDYQVIRLAKQTVLQKASVYYRNGMNPAQALYVEAKSMGFAAPELQPEVAKPKQQVKQPAKSAGMVGSRGGSAPQNSVKKDFAEGKMTLAEFSRLTPEQLQQLDARA